MRGLSGRRPRLGGVLATVVTVVLVLAFAAVAGLAGWAVRRVWAADRKG